ncbi:ABC transporter permease [Fodinibius salsisoli]|uniref:ABC transporter permease n=1 Tax=Fodinibius salsisoli TaxID=2820877 RepID=A0ABT3PLU9_9BACT|nr:ABC transporter permease [Fodinibius salsisoli]MCW9706925.1 ABC transporter permease [Fodinibius salsisoli]
MIKNYIKIAIRNLVHHKSYSLINLFGLTISMACCVLIALYINDEVSYDTFHEKSDRIIAVGSAPSFGGRMLSTPYPLADALVTEIPAVEKAVRVGGGTGRLLLSRNGNDYINVGSGDYTEPAFFDVFSFELLKGNPGQSLRDPNSIVLTQSAANQLFREGEELLGQPLYWQKKDTLITLEVTGVIEDAPHNTSVKYRSLISYNTQAERWRDPSAWKAFSPRTYALLCSAESLETLPGQFKELGQKYYETKEGEQSTDTFFAIPITGLHLSEINSSDGFTGSRTYLYLFGSAVLLILMIACVNYINLATARASLRAREVGVRKVVGAVRRQIATQFLGESVLLAIVSYIIGVGIAQLALPLFNDLFGTEVVWGVSLSFWLWLLLAAAGVGILAGIYPALYLSYFSPTAVLQDKLKQGPSGAWLRKTLVVGQFAMAITLIISALVLYNQLDYVQDKDLGFNDEQVVSVGLPNDQLWRLRDVIRGNLLSSPGIQEVSVGNNVPGSFGIRLGNKPTDISPQEEAATPDESIYFAPAVVDHHFLDLLDIDLLAGRNFSPNLSTDREQAYIINEKAAEKLGWSPKEAIGKSFGIRKEGRVIGVAENFHIASLREEMEPVVLHMFEPSSWSSSGSILARLEPGEIEAALNFIETNLEEYAPHQPFEYQFLDEKFDTMYHTERRLANIVVLFTFIIIVIACLGLYGLAAFSAERRTKEIGIRKVLGASVSGIVRLLSKDFLKLVLLGFMIAVPVSWYVINRWLQRFAYKIEIGAGIFLLAGGAAVLIALATVSWQSIKAALMNPVNSLRSE